MACRIQDLSPLCMCSVMSNSAPQWTVARQAPLSVGFFQARIMEWVAIFSSRGSSLPTDWIHVSCVSWIGRQILYCGATWEALLIPWKWSEVKVKSLSCVRLFSTLWIGAYQAPPSMGFSRQEYWSGLPFPSPGDLPDPGIKPGSDQESNPFPLHWQHRVLITGPPWKS